MTRVGVVCCSNGQRPEYREQNETLAQVLRSFGLEPVFSRCIYAGETASCGSGKQRARELMKLYEDETIREIFDISGGDLANEVLDYLDYDRIARTEKRFWGYSDLTTVLNAIYAKTGKPSVLYQIKNLVYEEGLLQRQRFSETLVNGTDSLFRLSYTFLRGTHMEGVVVGGNIRCLLKLAGTSYFPDMRGKLLLLESMGGEAPQIAAYLCQLKQMGVFDAVSGIILGTFTKAEKHNGRPTVEELVMDYAASDTPVVKTRQIGHGADAKAIVIGGYSQFAGTLCR